MPRRERRLFLVMGVALAASPSACTEENRPTSIMVSGHLGSEYAIAEPVDSTSSTNVHAVVAIPHHKGELTSDLLGRSKFHALSSPDFAIELETDTDWLLILLGPVDLPPEERLAGYIALGHSGGDGLVALPVTTATGDLDLGELTETGDTALSPGRLQEGSKSFSLDYDTLAEMAAMDDAYESIANAYLNYQGETYFTLVQTFEWRAPLETISESSLESYRFRGHRISVSTNDSASLDAYGEICTGDIGLALFVPGTVHSESGQVYSSASPLCNREPYSGDDQSCVAGDSAISHQGAELQLEFPASEYLVDTTTGYWRLELGGTPLAAFDLVSALPVNGATIAPKVPRPLPRLTVNRSPPALNVDVDWYYYDTSAKQYEPITDLRSLEQLVTASSVSLESVGGHTTQRTSGETESPVVTEAIFEGDWSRDGDPLLELVVEMQLAGSSYRFAWTERPYCGNARVDEGEVCDLDDLNGELCLTMGFGGGTLGCDNLCGPDTDDCLPAFTGSWSSTGSMSQPRLQPHAFLLDDGRVLVFGGGHASSEIWDSGSGQFSPGASMSADRDYSRAIELSDGRILVTGGSVGEDSASATSEIWDPLTESFAPGPDLLQARKLHSMALRSDGTVLISGGTDATDTALASAEIMDVDSGVSVATDSDLPFPRRLHTSLTLADGRILLIGGYETLPRPGGTQSVPAERIVEMTDLGSGLETWPYEEGQSWLGQGRVFHSATRLGDGRILVAGGESEYGPTWTAELIDPELRVVERAPDLLRTARKRHSATRLSSGHVLIVGGSLDDDPLNPCSACRETEAFYLVPGHFAPAAPMEVTRMSHTAVALSWGSSVLIMGGFDGSSTQSDAFVFTK